MKKLLASLLTISLITTPVIGVVGCGVKEPEMNSSFTYANEITSVDQITPSLLKQYGVKVGSEINQKTIDAVFEVAGINTMEHNESTKNFIQLNLKVIALANNFLYQISKIPGYEWMASQMRMQSSYNDISNITSDSKEGVNISKLLTEWMPTISYLGISVTFLDAKIIDHGIEKGQTKYIGWNGTNDIKYARINFNQRAPFNKYGDVIPYLDESNSLAVHTDEDGIFYNGKTPIDKFEQTTGNIYQGFVTSSKLIDMSGIYDEFLDATTTEMFNWTPSAADLVNNLQTSPLNIGDILDLPGNTNLPPFNSEDWTSNGNDNDPTISEEEKNDWGMDPNGGVDGDGGIPGFSSDNQGSIHQQIVQGLDAYLKKYPLIVGNGVTPSEVKNIMLNQVFVFIFKIGLNRLNPEYKDLFAGLFKHDGEGSMLTPDQEKVQIYDLFRPLWTNVNSFITTINTNLVADEKKEKTSQFIADIKSAYDKDLDIESGLENGEGDKIAGELNWLLKNTRQSGANEFDKLCTNILDSKLFLSNSNGMPKIIELIDNNINTIGTDDSSKIDFLFYDPIYMERHKNKNENSNPEEDIEKLKPFLFSPGPKTTDFYFKNVDVALRMGNFDTSTLNSIGITIQNSNNGEYGILQNYYQKLNKDVKWTEDHNAILSLNIIDLDNVDNTSTTSPFYPGWIFKNSVGAAIGLPDETDQTKQKDLLNKLNPQEFVNSFNSMALQTITHLFDLENNVIGIWNKLFSVDSYIKDNFENVPPKLSDDDLWFANIFKSSREMISVKNKKGDLLEYLNTYGFIDSIYTKETDKMTSELKYFDITIGSNKINVFGENSNKLTQYTSKFRATIHTEIYDKNGKNQKTFNISNFYDYWVRCNEYNDFHNPKFNTGAIFCFGSQAK